MESHSKVMENESAWAVATLNIIGKTSTQEKTIKLQLLTNI